MNIIEAAKAVLADYDKLREMTLCVCREVPAMEALRKAVAESDGMVLVPWQTTNSTKTSKR